MNYKDNDRVKIKSLDWYNDNKNKFGKVWTSDGLIPFDKCMSKWCGKVMTISQVREDHYTMVEDLKGYWTDEMFEGLAEEGVGLVDEFSNRWINELKLPEGYIFKDENGNIINATKIVLEKKKKEYPKTYEECYKITNLSKISDIYGYKNGLLFELQKLLIARDAYWKIAGEEIGLGKPWEADWKNGNQTKYCIYNDSDDIKKDSLFFTNTILSFPTAEMQDAFYENFKSDIEFCKELL